MTGEVESRTMARAKAAELRSATLDYTHQLLRELRQLTDAENEQFISYLIGMAYVATGDRIRELFGKEELARLLKATA